MQGYTPPSLAFVVCVGFLLVVLALVAKPVQLTDTAAIALGTLGAAFMNVIGFYFGSSQGSREKDKK